MRIQRTAIAATVALLGGFALSACSGSSNAAVAAGTQSPQASVSASASAPASAPSSPSTSVPSSAPSSGSGSTGTGTSGSGGTVRCDTSNLGFSIGPDSGVQAVGDTVGYEVVKLTNKGSGSCALLGFPGVDLKTNYGTVSVPRGAQTPKEVVLKPGRSALFTIDYPVNSTGGSGIKVESMVITPPNETHSYTMAWSEGTLPVTDGSGPSLLKVYPVVSYQGTD